MNNLSDATDVTQSLPNNPNSNDGDEFDFESETSKSDSDTETDELDEDVQLKRKKTDTKNFVTANKRVRAFPKLWLKCYKWLQYDKVKGVMTCKLCQKHGRSGPWVSGTNNFRSKTVKKHLSCNAHKASVKAENPGQKTLPRTFTENQEKRKNSIVAALRTVYWTATEEVANRKYSSLLKLQRLQGVQEIENLCVGGNATYDSPDIFNQLLAAINSIIEIEIREKKSSNRSLYRQKFIDISSAKLETVFLKCKVINDGTAKAIYQVFKQILADSGIEITKVLGLGTDGASVKMGHLNGITALIQEHNPFCVCVHCVCHRLNLALSQSCKDIDEMKTSITIVMKTLITIMSASRQKEPPN
ncbi:zinc finger 862-like [Paramuricea clavata]|uniref:Zinc finger 862-like n=1 Tax=Paramuricea clavata TaxID=317549 RepID=A0A7D9HV05_PARCT|nr:zinc finger 862-like [Paramuricea clavata]